ncbi:IS110 family transposase [Streptomyces deserti]
MARIWAGIDISKTHHHCVVLDAEGKRLLSPRVLNDELDLLALLADVLAMGEDVVWAVDVADGMATLWINVLLNHGQQLVYIPALAVNRGSASYRGTGSVPRRQSVRLGEDVAVDVRVGQRPRRPTRPRGYPQAGTRSGSSLRCCPSRSHGGVRDAVRRGGGGARGGGHGAAAGRSGPPAGDGARGGRADGSTGLARCA